MDHTGTFKMVGDELEAFRRAPIFHLSMSAKVRAREDITPGALQHQRAAAGSTSSKQRAAKEATASGSDGNWQRQRQELAASGSNSNVRLRPK